MSELMRVRGKGILMHALRLNQNISGKNQSKVGVRSRLR